MSEYTDKMIFEKCPECGYIMLTQTQKNAHQQKHD